MKILKYLFALWVGVFIYTVFTLLSGAMGLSAYSQLEGERDKELANIELLVQANQSLENSKNTILSDRDAITVLAREQGLVSPGEFLARIVGMGAPQRVAASPGLIISPLSPEYTPDRYIKIFSFFSALIILVCVGIYDLLRYLKDR